MKKLMSSPHHPSHPGHLQQQERQQQQQVPQHSGRSSRCLCRCVMTEQLRVFACNTAR
jgi:hypothetical protein